MTIRIKISLSILLATGIIIGAIVLLSGLCLYSGVWNPSWNPFKNTSEQILQKAMLNLIDAETGKINASFQTVLTSLNSNQQIEASAEIAGAYDKKEKDKPKGEGSFTVNVGVEGINILFEGEMKFIGEDFYVKFNTIPPFLPMGELNSWKNKWIRFKNSTLEKQGKTNEEIFDYSKLSSQEIGKRIAQKAEELVRKNKILDLKKNLGEEKVNNKKAYHYLVSLNKQGTKIFLSGILEEMQKYVREERKAEFEKNLMDFSQNFEKNWEVFKEIEFEV